MLIQHGKGADIGAAFGSGASNTVFGSQGTGSFLFKLTGGLAMAFFITSLSLSYLVSSQYQKAEQQIIPQQPQVCRNQRFQYRLKIIIVEIRNKLGLFTVRRHPERNGRHPERSGRHPERSGRHPERSGRHPERSEGSPWLSTMPHSGDPSLRSG